MKRVLELAAVSRPRSRAFWLALSEVLLCSTEYDSFRDIVDIIEKIKDSDEFSEMFWERMIDKLVTWKEFWTTKDMIGILVLF